MADESQSARPGASATTSSSSTRRSSQIDVMTRSAPDVRDQSPRDPVRRGLKPLQSYKLDDPQRLVSSEATSPATTRPQRSPQLLRRPSAKIPRRGQEFSVDDDSNEVEAETSQQDQSKRATASGSMRSINPSTIRRRATAHTPRLPFIDSADGDDDEEQPPGRTTPRVDRKDFEPRKELSRRNTVDDSKNGARAKSQAADDAETQSDNEDDEDSPADDNNDDDEDDDGDLSDAESFTLKDRQEAINETHPFGIRIWKPALYKKGRSVEKDAEGDIHSAPGGNVSKWLVLFNYAWTIFFGWWLAAIAAAGAVLCNIFAFAPGCGDYGAVLWGLAGYIFHPFGKYVKLISEEAYADEDEGEGRSISEYERWQQGDLEEGRLFFGPTRSLVGRRRSEEHSDDETESLLGRTDAREDSPTSDENGNKSKRRLFGRGQWNLGRVIFFVFFYGLITPTLFLVSMLCWLLVFTIPMARVTLILLRHLRRRPLALEFHADTIYTRGGDAASSAIILCTYRAVGTKYWKYTIDGTNIFLINLLGVVAFVIFDYWVLYTALGLHVFITNTIFVFLLALFSIIPLAYFIGQAVASISAQSTMGVGAAINAFFSTIVEVFLYCVALQEGKARLVEGALIGSIFAGILLLPGISMCFGAIKRKTQRFNVRSAGVTTTMLLFAVIGSFSPTLFYEIYGSHEINCHQCKDEFGEPLDRDCRRCFFAQVPANNDSFYLHAVRPYSWFAAGLLFLSYVIGLLFTLRTHAATIWAAELDEKKVEKMEGMAHRGGRAGQLTKTPSLEYGAANSQLLKTPTTPGSTLPRVDIRDSHLYKRILGQSLKQAGLGVHEDSNTNTNGKATPSNPGGMDGSAESTALAPEDGLRKRNASLEVSGLSAQDSDMLIRHMAEMAATAATVAARDSTQNPRKASVLAKTPTHIPVERIVTPKPTQTTHSIDGDAHHGGVAGAGHETTAAGGGHDAPNWGRVKSYTVLLSATLAYAVIAEILVNTVDAVLANVDIDEKFLGITLFALVPNTTEFLNAISFAMNGNIALSMEIGSAYALQVCLLQIPAVVLFSAVYGQFIDPTDVIDHTFRLLFPQWDMVTVILCVFLLSYMYGEGKSNYFKGSILILSYIVVITGFYLVKFSEADAGHGNDGAEALGAGGTRMVLQGGMSRNAFVM